MDCASDSERQMNLAELHSPLYEYRAVALSRFADTKLNFAEEFDLIGKINASRPVIRTRTQMTLWKILTESKRPLKTAEIYGRFEDELSEGEKSGLRHQLAKWALKRFIDQSGGKTAQRYVVRQGVPRL